MFLLLISHFPQFDLFSVPSMSLLQSFGDLSTIILMPIHILQADGHFLGLIFLPIRLIYDDVLVNIHISAHYCWFSESISFCNSSLVLISSEYSECEYSKATYSSSIYFLCSFSKYLTGLILLP